MRLLEMTTFVVLVRHRHFGRTALELNTTQPAISARLAVLEEEFGCRLIDRVAGGFKLTAEGEKVLEVSRHVLECVDALKADLKRPNAEPATVIRIGAIDSISSTWMPSLVEALHGSMSNIRIELTIESTQRLVQGMNKGEFDLIFAVDPAIGEGFRSFVSCVLRMIWAASPRLIDPGRVYSVKELAQLPIISFPRNTAPYRHIAPYFEDESVLASKLTSSNSLFAIIKLALDGFGVAALPAVTLERELQDGSLCATPVIKALSPMPIIATYQSSTHQDVIVRVVNEARARARAFFSEHDPSAIPPE